MQLLFSLWTGWRKPIGVVNLLKPIFTQTQAVAIRLFPIAIWYKYPSGPPAIVADVAEPGFFECTSAKSVIGWSRSWPRLENLQVPRLSMLRRRATPRRNVCSTFNKGSYEMGGYLIKHCVSRSRARPWAMLVDRFKRYNSSCKAPPSGNEQSLRCTCSARVPCLHNNMTYP